MGALQNTKRPLLRRLDHPAWLFNNPVMEKFFLKRRTFSIENWQIGLLLIVVVLSFVGFGALVEWAGRKEDGAPGIAKLSMQIAQLPIKTRRTIRHLHSSDHPMRAREQRFEGEAGFVRFEAGEDEALLLARFNGDENRSVVEIVNLQNGAVLHRYAPDIGALNRRSTIKAEFIDLSRDKNPQRYPISHPYLTDDGGLIFHGMITPLAKIDVCSNIVWMIDGVFHHSIESDADGNFWTASDLIPPLLPHVTAKGRDNTLVKFSPDGEILFEKSVGEILIENELEHLIYNVARPDDPTHINDIQPVLATGPHWRKGDLFLSLRSSSAIVIYRPSTNEVVWHRTGPWMMQHDIDILNDHQISVFDNNMAVLPWGERGLGVSDTIVYDFSTGGFSSPFSDGFELNEIRTPTEGRSQILPDGELFIEEQNHGRLVKMNTAGDITWQYINRANDGRVYTVHWSRYIEKSRALEAAKASEQCKAAP